MSAAGRALVVAAGAALAAGVGGAARADDASRRGFLADRDPKALLAFLEGRGPSRGGGAPDAEDLARRPLARLAADPAADAPADAPALVRAVARLRRLDLDGARALVPAAVAEAPTAGAWLDALGAARRGQDATAVRRLTDAAARAGDGVAAFELALLGVALPSDDRAVLAAVARDAVVEFAADGRGAEAAALAEAAAAFDPATAAPTLVAAARALRRGGDDRRAAALLEGPAAVGPEVVLERALAAWRRGDGAAARAAVASVRAPTTWTWAFAALAAAGPAPATVPAPPQRVARPADDPTAAALARLLAVLGVPARADELEARARQRGVPCADPGFQREVLAAAGATAVEVAGDAAAARAAALRGLPLLVRPVRRRGDGFAEAPVVVRGLDPATDLLLVDEPDPARPDALPAAWLGKLRYAIVAPTGRGAELAAWRDLPAARRGEALAADLAPLARGAADRAADAVAARAAAAPDDPVLALHQGLASWAAGAAARDDVRRGVGGTLLRRTAAVPPVLGVERYVRTTESAWSRDEADAAAADLAAIEGEEGPSAWAHAARFVVFEAARRHAEALAAVAAALERDPLDVRTLYFRGTLRRLVGDAAGARDDLVRVLDRRPDTLAAAEDLVALHLEAGAPDRALAVVEALLAADPAAAAQKRVRQLRQRTEVRVVRRARSAADLAALAASPEPDTRKEVAWTVATFETPAAEALLRRLLADDDEGVRRKAAQGFQRPWLVDRAAADAALRDALAARVATDPSATVREALVLALARLESDAGDAALAPRLAGAARDPDAGVRAAVADAFLRREGPAVRRALVAALEDPESVVRATALRALVRLGGSARGFEPDDPPERRAEAVRAWRAWLDAAR